MEKGRTYRANCENCGASFSYRFNVKPRRFCSESCRVTHHKRAFLTCYYCGEIESNQVNLEELSPVDLDHPIRACRLCSSVLRKLDALSEPTATQMQHISDEIALQNGFNATFAEWYIDNVQDVANPNVRDRVVSLMKAKQKAERRFAYMTLKVSSDAT